MLQNTSGDVLELGCGTGANLEFYPDTVKRLVLIEPSIHMRKKLQAKLSNNTQINIELINDNAENLSLPDASFDAVVCTLVLCSVKHLGSTLSEIYRVLRPKGKLFFIEHVAATDNIKQYKWQRRLSFLWKCIAAGCHITRRTEDAITQAGFEIVKITCQDILGAPKIVRPSIRGIAVKH
ncbi:TPA: class I SAM-dependent methyltransferase [Legionella pneumophila]